MLGRGLCSSFPSSGGESPFIAGGRVSGLSSGLAAHRSLPGVFPVPWDVIPRLGDGETWAVVDREVWSPCIPGRVEMRTFVRGSSKSTALESDSIPAVIRTEAR